MEESKETAFIENTCFDPVDYFEDIIGVSRIEGQTLQRIVLFFTAKSAPYILSKPLHGSQRIVSKSEEGVTHYLRSLSHHLLTSLTHHLRSLAHHL
ncbi:MAG: hypothetical protein EAS52_17760 [Parapedobacter sp.]|nr:MAG: hypothetical protein EAS52_17760 [Parapedobacter sp.]